MQLNTNLTQLTQFNTTLSTCRSVPRSQDVHVVRGIKNLAAFRFQPQNFESQKCSQAEHVKMSVKIWPPEVPPSPRSSQRVEVWPQDSKESLGQMAPLLSQAIMREVCSSQLRDILFGFRINLYSAFAGCLTSWFHLAIPISHGLKFCHLYLIESFECCLWVIFSKLLTFCFETETPNECLSYRLCVNGLVFTSGIWIYKVKLNPKISWEVPRFKNKQSQTCLSKSVNVNGTVNFFQVKAWSKCTLFPGGQSFCSLLLLNHIFSPTLPPHPPPIAHSML